MNHGGTRFVSFFCVHLTIKLTQLQAFQLESMKSLSLLYSALLLASGAVHGVYPSPHKPMFAFRERAQTNATLVVQKRVVTELSTCGYYNGDPKLPRTANPGYNCRVDTKHALFGFCPTTVIAATDCGLAAACIDSYSCSNGCGYTTDPTQTTWTCGSGDQPPYCSTALLTFGIDQTYTYLGCGATAKTDHYMVTPTGVIGAASTVTSVSAVTITRSAVPAVTPTRSTISSPSSSTASTIASMASVSLTDTVALSESNSSTSTPSPPLTAMEGGGTNVPLGPVIGGVLGGLALICASTLIAIYLVRRNRSQESSPGSHRERGNLDDEVMSSIDLKTSRHYSGWGPRELPASFPGVVVRGPPELPATFPNAVIPPRSPVELPGHDVDSRR